MTDAINSNEIWLDAAQCWLMAEMASRMGFHGCLMFWETLPDSIPNLTAHLPALTAAVKDEKDPMVLDGLSSHPLPAILSPEIVAWRPRLIAAWEAQLESARGTVCRSDVPREWQAYISSLRGLVQVDGCGVPPGTTCPSVLPTLLNEVRYLDGRVKTSRQFKCLDTMAGWRPGPNVMADPVLLKEWGGFWLELYQKGYMDVLCDDPGEPVILKGMAAKALLNLMESGDEEKTGVPADMKTLLIESLVEGLTMAADIAGTTMENMYYLRLLSWEPQDATRFPTDRLAKLPEILLKKVGFLCREPDSCWNGKLLHPLSAALDTLVRWDRNGLLAACRVDLCPRILTDVSHYLNNCMRNGDVETYFLNRKLYRWLVRSEVANTAEGRKLLQKLETHWRRRCELTHEHWGPRVVAWEGRIRLQRAGLATETPAAFQKDLLEAIKKEKSAEVRVMLSLWRLEKDTPDMVRKRWERFWQKGLKSDSYGALVSSALSILKPDSSEDIATRRQKLEEAQGMLPKKLRPKLSIAELVPSMEGVG